MTSISGVTSRPSIDSSAITDLSDLYRQNHLTLVVLRVMGSAAVSALAAGLFSTVGPMGGAVYGIACTLSHVTVERFCDKVGCLGNDTIGRTLWIVLPLIASIAAGCAVLAATGFVFAPGAIVAIEIGSRGLQVVAGVMTGALLLFLLMKVKSSAGPRSSG